MVSVSPPELVFGGQKANTDTQIQVRFKWLDELTNLMAGKRNRARFEEDLQAIQSPYVIYGTPLPPLDANVRDDGSFVPIWKQEVTDERGRKRLHGAFTGGFSAGYAFLHP